MNKINSKVKINRNALTCLLIAICFVQFCNGQASAEDISSALGFEQNINDVPETPINTMLGIIALIGSYLGIKKIKR